MRYAVLRNATVENIIEWDGVSDFNPGPGLTLQPDSVGMAESGFLWTGTEFRLPQPYPSWVYNSQTFQWEAPEPYPSDGRSYAWDEQTETWWLVDSL